MGPTRPDDWAGIQPHGAHPGVANTDADVSACARACAGTRGQIPRIHPLCTRTHTRSVRLDTTGHAHARTHTHTHRGTISHGPTHWGQRGTMREQASMHARASSPEPPPHPNNHTQAPAFTHAGMPPPILACLQTMTGLAQMARPHQRRGMPTRTYARTHARTHTHTHARARWAQAQRGHGCKAWRVPGQRRRRTGPRQEAQALQCRTST